MNVFEQCLRITLFRDIRCYYCRHNSICSSFVKRWRVTKTTCAISAVARVFILPMLLCRTFRQKHFFARKICIVFMYRFCIIYTNYHDEADPIRNTWRWVFSIQLLLTFLQYASNIHTEAVSDQAIKLSANETRQTGFAGIVSRAVCF